MARARDPRRAAPRTGRPPSRRATPPPPPTIRALRVLHGRASGVVGDAKASATAQGRRALTLLVTSVVVVGILFAFVLPARSTLAQRSAVARAEERTKVLDEQTRRLRARADTLRTDAEIERLAREQYGMVRPGEEAFAILPAKGTPPTAPPAVAGPEPEDESALEAVWRKAQFWR